MIKIDETTFMKVGADMYLPDTWIYKHDAPIGTERWTNGNMSIFDVHSSFYDVKCGKIQTGG